MPDRVYLDWNATATLRPEARAAAIRALGITGNPSSVHAEGRAARELVEAAREKVAALTGVAPACVIFTAGGTEANNLALSPQITTEAARAPRQRLLVSAIEHPSVLAGGRFSAADVERLPVTPDGVLDLAALAARLKALALEGVTRPLVSLMLANNETGVIQPVAAAAAIVSVAGGLLHVDAVQAAGRIDCDIKVLGADLLTLSAHKLGGPKGVGALIKADENLHFADPLLKGGGQERGVRAGTENVAAIAGFGAAIGATDMAAEISRLRGLRDRLEAGIRAISPDAVFFGAGAERLPNTTLCSVPGFKAETAVIGLDLAGIGVSSGAACSSGKVQPSHVLAAMGVEPVLARGAVRVSLGYSTTESDIEMFLNAWKTLSESLRKGGRSIAA